MSKSSLPPPASAGNSPAPASSPLRADLANPGKGSGEPRVLRPLKAMRLNCLDCSGGSRKYVAWCPCDGLHSTRCQLWPYRFGLRPETTAERYGEEFVTAELMADANTPLEVLPDEAPQKRVLRAARAQLHLGAA